MDAGIPFHVPPAHLLPDRPAAVLAAVYLSFNEGYGDRGSCACSTARTRCAPSLSAGFLERRQAELS